MMESFGRIHALLLRYFYILKGSPARIIDIAFWPSIQMILWGFISRFLAVERPEGQNALAYALGTFLGAVILWDMLFRTQIAVFIAYLEEVWARNLGHLFVSPLRPWEWWLSMVLFSFFRVAVGIGPAVLLAIPFYGFSLFDLGLPLLFFFFNLMLMGWWLGFFITSVLIRTGPGAEGLAWAFTFMLSPFCAVYYPVSTLPVWLQPVAHALPASHVFEGLRLLVQKGVFDPSQMWSAFLLNIFYLIVSIALLQASFNSARRQGTILQSG